MASATALPSTVPSWPSSKTAATRRGRWRLFAALVPQPRSATLHATHPCFTTHQSPTEDWESLAAALAQAAPLARDAPLAPLTSWGVGGPARLLARPGCAAELVAVLDACRVHGAPFHVSRSRPYSGPQLAERGRNGPTPILGTTCPPLRPRLLLLDAATGPRLQHFI